MLNSKDTHNKSHSVVWNIRKRFNHIFCDELWQARNTVEVMTKASTSKSQSVVTETEVILRNLLPLNPFTPKNAKNQTSRRIPNFIL